LFDGDRFIADVVNDCLALDHHDHLRCLKKPQRAGRNPAGVWRGDEQSCSVPITRR
jgi:hypothetical protein